MVARALLTAVATVTNKKVKISPPTGLYIGESRLTALGFRWDDSSDDEARHTPEAPPEPQPAPEPAPEPAHPVDDSPGLAMPEARNSVLSYRSPTPSPEPGEEATVAPLDPEPPAPPPPAPAEAEETPALPVGSTG